MNIWNIQKVKIYEWPFSRFVSKLLNQACCFTFWSQWLNLNLVSPTPPFILIYPALTHVISMTSTVSCPLENDDKILPFMLNSPPRPAVLKPPENQISTMQMENGNMCCQNPDQTKGMGWGDCEGSNPTSLLHSQKHTHTQTYTHYLDTTGNV